MTSEYIISEIGNTKGTDKKYMIYALGSMNDNNAEKYYSELLKKPDRNLHYLCHCCCKCVSDYAADEMEKVIDKLITLDGYILPQDMNDVLWTTLNLCAFKDSERFFMVLEKIGKNYNKLKHCEMDIHYLMFSHSIKPFLSHRAHKWWASCCEDNFIYALNDMLVCSITRLGDAFAQKIISLGDHYPECYGRAALFADFSRDNHAAYDKYAAPENSDLVLSIMNGVNYSNTKSYYLYSPYWFMDNSNKIYHSRTRLGKLDIRWTEHLCRLAENTNAVCSHYKTRYGLDVSSYRHMSRMMLGILDISDERQKNLLRKYFEYAAALYANEADMEGLELFGEYNRSRLIEKALENISSGRSRRNILCHILNGMKCSKKEKLTLIAHAEQYIYENFLDNERVQNEFISLTKQYRKKTKHT